MSNVTEYIDDESVRNIVLPKLLQAFEKNLVDSRILMNVIPCILNRLEKQKIIDCILPLLFNVKLQEPEIIVRVVRKYTRVTLFLFFFLFMLQLHTVCTLLLPERKLILRNVYTLLFTLTLMPQP